MIPRGILRAVLLPAALCVAVCFGAGEVFGQDVGADVGGGAGIFRAKNPEAKRKAKPATPTTKPSNRTRLHCGY
jgi:hypothetical protein